MAQHGTVAEMNCSVSVKWFLAILFLPVLLTSCNNTKTEAPKEKEAVQAPVNVPSFNPDSSYIYTKAQVDFGPRIPNTTAHKKCGDYLVAQLKQWCDTVIEQQAPITAYDGKVLQMRNIIGSFNPSRNNRIVLCAHWDTRPWADQDKVRPNDPFDGANDGAASAAVLLEVARQLAASDNTVGVDVILFDLEDYGKSEIEDSYCYGSQYWSVNKHVADYQARFGILLDMVSAENTIFTKEGTSMQYAPDVVDLVWKTAAGVGYANRFIPDESAGIIDDHYYINRRAGIKCIDLVHYEYGATSHFWKHWHTHEDTMDKIDRNSMKVVGQTLLELLFRQPS